MKRNIYRRGQIFLILTILVITFLVGITSVLLDVQQAEYYTPSPDADDTLLAWETTIESIKQTMDVQLAINSSAGDPSGVVDISVPLNNIVRYLNERGLSASITVVGTVDYTIAGDATADTTVDITGTFNVYIKSSTTEISQTVTLSVSYNARSSVASTAFVSRTVDGSFEYITNSTFSDPNAIDQADGSYTNLAAGLVIVTTPTGIVLNVDIQ